ncbi:hypothetical protein QJS04_geneDACA020235 [Acorus gramineus]|uniref:Rhodopsin n=1 Tax=Acorus gramineus TaxID=55184 RepID=A0AAV9A3W4_ACOGR|nr:hypothetical protein QJS04_geneDACA020235 [Acorus gramineus]
MPPMHERMNRACMIATFAAAFSVDEFPIFLMGCYGFLVFFRSRQWRTDGVS